MQAKARRSCFVEHATRALQAAVRHPKTKGLVRTRRRSWLRAKSSTSRSLAVVLRRDCWRAYRARNEAAKEMRGQRSVECTPKQSTRPTSEARGEKLRA
eukprot:4933225-Pleurochrysis_carterae.AAC.1